MTHQLKCKRILHISRRAMTKLSPQAFIPSKSFREILQFNKIQNNKIKEGFSSPYDVA
jgi:hypothetical protein